MYQNNIEIIDMTYYDLQFFVDVRNKSREYLHNNTEFTLANVVKWFSETKPSFYIIKLDDVSIGYFRTSNYNTETNSLYIGCDIHPEYRGLGLAYKAYIKFIKQLRESGIDSIQLEVLSTNTRAINLYKKLGFVDIGISNEKIKRNDAIIDSIIMELKNKPY